MSESDLDLGESDSDEKVSFPPAERKLVTQPYDLSIQTLFEQWRNKVLVLPSIQREYVWDNGRASRLIESLLLNIPIPIIYLSENESAEYEIIDGHQRINSIARYLQGEFALSGLHILSEYKGLRFHQLPQREQRFLLMRTLRAVVITQESHPNMKFEVFERLNTGSIMLNAQELRNSIYRGRFNDLLHLLVKNEDFRFVIGSKKPRKRMVDQELILRFLALRARFHEYKPPLKRFLNDYMNSQKFLDEAAFTESANIFTNTIAAVRSYLGESAFRVSNSSGIPLEKQVNRALFDATMFSFSFAQTNNVPRENVLTAMAELYQDDTFLDSIRRATGDRSRTRRRIRQLIATLEQVGFTITQPFDLDN